MTTMSFVQKVAEGKNSHELGWKQKNGDTKSVCAFFLIPTCSPVRFVVFVFLSCFPAEAFFFFFSNLTSTFQVGVDKLWSHVLVLLQPGIFQGCSRVMIRPADRVRRFLISRGSSRVGSGRITGRVGTPDPRQVTRPVRCAGIFVRFYRAEGTAFSLLVHFHRCHLTC